LSTSQQPTTLYGTAASPAICCDCCLIDTWSTCSWRWLTIAALCLPPEIRCLKNNVPYGSVLSPLLFNIYISDLPTTISRKYAYADDLAIMRADGDWQAVEGVLSKDMITASEYLQAWELKLSTTKTVSTGFHLNNQEVKRELKVNHNNETLPFCSEPKYLVGTLDRSLTHRRHLESLCKKLTSRVAHLMRLADSGWGAGAATLRTASVAPVHLSAEHCAPVWSAVLIPALSTPPSTTPCEMWLDACALHQRITFHPSQASNLLSFVAVKLHCL